MEQDIRHTCGGGTQDEADYPAAAVAPSSSEPPSYTSPPSHVSQHVTHHVTHRHYDPPPTRIQHEYDPARGQHPHDYQADPRWREFPQGVPYEYLSSAHSAGNLSAVHHQQVVKEQFIAQSGGPPPLPPTGPTPTQVPLRSRPGIPPRAQGIPAAWCGDQEPVRAQTRRGLPSTSAPRPSTRTIPRPCPGSTSTCTRG